MSQLVIAMTALAVVACGGGSEGVLDYTAPPDAAMPADPSGAAVRRGLALVLRTSDSLPANCAPVRS